MRWPDIRKLGNQIGVWPHFVSSKPSISDDGHEDIGGVIIQGAAIVWEGRRAGWIIVENVRQQSGRNPPCLIRGKPSDMLQRVGEDRNETGIIRRLAGAIGC